jgi:hypothetical protein
MKAVHGDRWLHYASRAQGSTPGSPLDAYGLVKTMIDLWRDVFDEAFPQRKASGSQLRLHCARGPQRYVAPIAPATG